MFENSIFPELDDGKMLRKSLYLVVKKNKVSGKNTEKTTSLTIMCGDYINPQYNPLSIHNIYLSIY
jgi:hypothetical protein